MAEGTIKKLTDKGFGFISSPSGNDVFFHMSAVEGVRYEDLREGQKVTYNEGRGPKGPRAENVRHTLHGLGISHDRMSYIGYGESKPKVVNSSDANRAANRRVQFVVL